MPRVLNPLPLEQRCTRCRHRARMPGSTSCEPCATKRREAMRVQRAAAREAAARERTTAQSGYPDAHNGQNAQPHNRSDKSNERSNGDNVPAADALMGVFGMRREQERSPGQENSLVAMLMDLHIPEEDKPACEAVFAWLTETQPDVVVLGGDVGEFESCSAHGTSPDAPTYKADLLAVTQWLSKLRRTVPRARIVYLEGNHETRAERLRCALVPRLAGHRGLWEDLDLPSLGIEWWPQDKVFSIGTLDVVHGHQLGERPGKFCAARLAEVYGTVGRTAVMGHAHRRQIVERAHIAGNAVGVSVGCLRTLHPSWLKGTEYGWVHGFAVANVQPGRRTSVETIEINDGALWYGGRCYRG